jgi:hypothetical protein
MDKLEMINEIMKTKDDYHDEEVIKKIDQVLNSTDYIKTEDYVEDLKDTMDTFCRWITDYQFDKTDENYLGFINIGANPVDRRYINFICDNEEIFKSILDKVGMEFETLNVNEVIITQEADITNQGWGALKN